MPFEGLGSANSFRKGSPRAAASAPVRASTFPAEKFGPLYKSRVTEPPAQDVSPRSRHEAAAEELPLDPSCNSGPEGLPDRSVAFESWLHSCLSLAATSRVGLNSFIHDSFRGLACTAQPAELRGDPWPVPLPVLSLGGDGRPMQVHPRPDGAASSVGFASLISG